MQHYFLKGTCHARRNTNAKPDAKTDANTNTKLWRPFWGQENSNLERAEVAARNAKIGLWSDPNAIAPWDWRLGESTRVVAQSQAATPKIDDANATANDPTVYVTRTGSKYHLAGCRYLSKSSIPIKLSEAEKQYSPCSVCCKGDRRIAAQRAVPAETPISQAAATETPSPDMPTTDPQPSVTPSYGQTFVGPRGGVYHYSKSGKKVYQRHRR